MRPDQPFSWRSKSTKHAVLIVILILLTLYVVLPNVHAFGLSLHGALPRDWLFMIGSPVVFLVTFLVASLSYHFLALHKVKLRQLLLIQLASMPLHVLLPAGIGEAGVNFLYLRGQKHGKAEAGVVVIANNMLGVLGNVSMLLLLFMLYGVNKNLLNLYAKHETYLLSIGSSLIILILAVGWFLNSRIKIAITIRRRLLDTLSKYHGRGAKTAGAYACALALSSLTALAFFLALRAYGIGLSFALDFLIYALSILLGTIIPTPGGLGAVEASMTAGIVAVHGASAAVALSAVLAYRAASYWLPLFIGLAALGIAQKRRLIWRPKKVAGPEN